MSRKLFTFLLSELTIVRVICKREKCDGTVEVPISSLSNVADAKCPKCGKMFQREGDANTLLKLDMAIDEAKNAKTKERFDIEFVVPDESK